MNYNELLEKHQVDALWVTNADNKRYISGFTGSTCEVIILKDEVLFITDGRYKTQIKHEIKTGIKTQILESNAGYQKAVIEVLKNVKTVGIESTHLSVAQFNTLKDSIENIELVAIADIWEELRICKSADEIDKIRKAVAITDKVFTYLVNNIKVGMSEIDVKLMLENQHIKEGAEAQSFEPIVASGPNSAMPHAHPSDRIICDGDILTIDFGCFKDGYCSDMTRTFFVGECKDEELRKIHGLVKETMNLQISHVKAGVLCSDIDAIGRNNLKEHGYDQYFIHGTGHGIGLQIHEEPYVNASSKTILEPGMVITIEPGIYIEGLGGVRIEQDVLVTEGGYEVLNQSDTSCDVYNK